LAIWRTNPGDTRYRRFIGGRLAALQKTKLTVRVPRELLENVKRYAAEHNTIHFWVFWE
jgi:hypothetical protein